MFVARGAAWAAVALAATGLLYAAIDGDVFLAASSISALFLGALFWTLADIGDRLGLTVSPAVERGHSATETETATAKHAREDFTQTDESGPSFFDLSRVAELERKLAAARAK